MREVGNAEIPAVIWAIALVVVGYLFILHQAKAAAARKVQIRKLQRLAAEEVARAEQEEAEEFSSKITRTSGSVFQNRSSSSVIISHPTPVTTAALSTPHSSPVVKRASFTGSSRASTALGLCAVCSNPTKKQCSRCKRVKYCSQQCQVQHWREWHKHECHESEKRLFSTDAQSNAVLSNLGSSIAKDDDSNINNVFNSSVFFSSQQCQVQHWQEGHKHECHECDESEKQLFSTDAQSNAVLSNLGFSIAKDDDSNINDISFEERLPEAPSKPSRTLETVTTDGSLPKPNKILFPYEHFIELFTWNKLKLVPCGLINCGNSCFASVVLQCLTYTRPLAAYLLEGRHSQECRRNKWCFMCELQHHVSRVRESQIPFSPIRIVSQIRNIGNHLGYGRQEDAHEFTRFAIDSMQSICLDKVGGEKAVDQRTQETTFIHHIFGGHLQSQVRCMQCHHESHKYENMMDLAVEIQGNVETLEDALAQFTAPEWLDGDNKYKCDRCNAYVKAWKRLAIHEAPNILTIALKRFQSGNFGKLNKRVTFPDVLDMSPYMSEEGDKPPHYQLYGVIVHIDMLNASFFGHYICYVKDLHGSWYKIDDSKVKEVDLDKVMQQRAYMLFYTRSGPRCAPIISKGGMQPVEGICVNSCNSKRTTMSNGNHILPELPSVFSNEAANGNGSNFYVSESNGVMLYSEDSDVLTQ